MISIRTRARCCDETDARMKWIDHPVNTTCVLCCERTRDRSGESAESASSRQITQVFQREKFALSKIVPKTHDISWAGLGVRPVLSRPEVFPDFSDRLLHAPDQVVISDLVKRSAAT